MSSVLSDILTHFEIKVEAAVPAIRKSRYYYGTNQTDDVNNSHTYAVRPGSAQVVPGNLRSATYEQEIEVEVTKEFIEKGPSDTSLRNAVETIMQDHEAINNLVVYHAIDNVKQIKHPSFSAPSVDQERKLVSIVFTYPVTYAKSISGS